MNYYVQDEYGYPRHIIVPDDPRQAGYKGQVQQIHFQADIDGGAWEDGAEAPESMLAVSLSDPSHFRDFRSVEEASAAGYQVLDGNWGYFTRWSEVPPRSS